jgi:hypothetical protein
MSLYKKRNGATTNKSHLEGNNARRKNLLSARVYYML